MALSGSYPELPDDRDVGTVRERLLRFGAEALSPSELLGLVLREGRREEEAVALAQRMLERFGGLRGSATRTAGELMELPGIGPARAARVQAAFALLRAFSEETLSRGEPVRSSAEIFERYHPVMRDLKREVFLSVLLDGKNRVLREDRVSVGSLTSSIVHPREVFVTAIRESADAVVFVHNHPSGDPTPSLEDIEITNRLVEVGRIVGIRVLDHVVVGEGAYTSFH
ncbi:MAG: RadC family protein, partial [Planctomycetota bacterium]